ncbi:putative hydrolase of the HAD superfamily [Pedobacter psychrotolerans]|uniref:Noncanonical pyrimidine nucleotidase, YjjG family protein n=1 Tax=Pedobacter psychrotolerans TaxID=1843235 RepID=A0A4R2HF85_9SPHI|nr:YjjG family noncanonical pyrimidine nucleotidase [Pedobacter psychrotolerans]TCO27169.1 putative hydrolase of the HAD superfamily [Pedobacter psychrotolerans]GGE59438.1 noncanonical pyrimidine nucleotidase, YjjG family protein [Pedobacter psychrotolerans]
MLHNKKHIFFDLDHTIWDFDRNAEETLSELYNTYNLKGLGLSSCADFILTYTENNHKLWADYHLGKITKDFLRAERFNKTFIQLGISPDVVPHQFEEDYVNISPTKTNLFDGAADVLTYLKEKYTLHIISNGFKETTLTKMELSNLNPYFENVIISEDVGVNKPNPRIFEYALERATAQKEESIMIGDSIEADIYGALNFGMEAIFFNPLSKEKPEDVKKEIKHLKDLINLF